MAQNRLRETTSLYLHQHADNPVHWQPWDDEAFALARRENKPVLLSIGYAACHWCHVMAHESFEDEATAALMNELYVNIKVDREERPDVDAIYMNALHLMGQRGGWPLTMFLTPEGEPFWGGTYFPNQPRYGQPAFTDVLRTIHGVYRSDPAAVTKNRDALAGGLAELSKSPPSVSMTPAVLDQIAEQLLGYIDTVHGGIGQAPKFPQTGMLELLWRAARRSGRHDFARAVTVTLDNMCQGGIYDHLRGGFARYSVDERWLVPHFEKMLYDNAALVELLTTVWTATRSPLYAHRIEETIAWVLREMCTADRGFSAALDADSEGEEGKFYVWSAAEIAEVLGPDAAFFSSVYDVTAGGNWEHTNILNRLNGLALLDEQNETRLVSLREKLLARRAQRVRPALDDKMLADWNGLMIAALVRAGTAFGRSDWIEAARAAFAAVKRHLGKSDARLHHSFRDGRTQPNAFVEDYANMARAALLLEQATGEKTYLDAALKWTDTLARQYWDGKHGGYLQTADDADALITRSRSVSDNPTPNANGVMIEVHTRLYHRTGDAHQQIKADLLVGAFSGEVRRNFIALGAYLNGFDFLLRVPEVVIRGVRDTADTEALLRAAFAAPSPLLMVSVFAPDESLPAEHPATGTTQRDGRATAYVCRDGACSLPAGTADELCERLSEERDAASHTA